MISLNRKLQANESPDVYLADLKRLASLFGGLSDDTIICAFVAGLPDKIKNLLRASARLDSMTLAEVLGRVRVVVADD